MLSLSSEEAARVLEASPTGATVYLVGAGGCGMSGLGHLLLDRGFRIAGSDLAPNSDTRDLIERGGRILDRHEASHLRESRPVLVVYSSAIRRDNPELQAAGEL